MKYKIWLWLHRCSWIGLCHCIYSTRNGLAQKQLLTSFFVTKVRVKSLYSMLIWKGFSMNCCYSQRRWGPWWNRKLFCQRQYNFTLIRNAMQQSFLERLCLPSVSPALTCLRRSQAQKTGLRQQRAVTEALVRHSGEACLEITRRQAGCTVMPLTTQSGFWAPPRSAQTCPAQCQGAGIHHISPRAVSGQPSPHAHSRLVTCPPYYFCFLTWLWEEHPPLRCRQCNDKPSLLRLVYSIYFLAGFPQDFYFS